MMEVVICHIVVKKSAGQKIVKKKLNLGYKGGQIATKHTACQQLDKIYFSPTILLRIHQPASSQTVSLPSRQKASLCNNTVNLSASRQSAWASSQIVIGLQ